MDKIAIIDLGSNSARMVLANIIEGGYFSVFDEIKETVRLGENMQDGFLKPARVAEAIKTLKMFRKLCDANQIPPNKVFAYATNAVRRAKNQKGFLEEVNSLCGFKLNVLSETEEATRIYQGVINTLDVPKGLIIDISGNSTQLIRYNRRNILNIINLPFGSISLTEKFKDEEATPEEQAKRIEDFMTEQFAAIDWLKELDPETQLVGVGGAVRNLGRITRAVKKYPLDMAHNYRVQKDDFGKVYDMIKVLDPDKRLTIKGLSAGRADIFVSALSTIKAIFNNIEFPELVVSGSGIREGVLFSYAMPTTLEKPISDILGYSLNTTLRNFGENVQHAMQMYNLSMQLFKQLRVLHKLPRPFVKILRIASILHDTGMSIRYYDHHKHSFYCILNSNIYGATQREILLAAFVAAAHRKEGFSAMEWARYKDILNETDLIAVRKLGVILRIAESLDRTMSSGVVTINCDVLGDSVIMKTEVVGDCSLEINDALTAGVEFRKAFRKNLEIL